MSTSTAGPGRTSGDRGGRPALTSAHHLADVAQRLFLDRGFDETTVEDITTAAGVSRRTFFRYFSTKADVLWVESDHEIGTFRALLDAAPTDEHYAAVLRRAATAALTHTPDERLWAMRRAQLILGVPSVQEKAALRYSQWRATATAFVARRRGCGTDDMVAIAVGHAVLAATVAAHEYWIAHPDEELSAILSEMLRLLVPHD